MLRRFRPTVEERPNVNKALTENLTFQHLLTLFSAGNTGTCPINMLDLWSSCQGQSPSHAFQLCSWVHFTYNTHLSAMHLCTQDRNINGYWRTVKGHVRLNYWGNDLRWTKMLSRRSINLTNNFHLAVCLFNNMQITYDVKMW